MGWLHQLTVQSVCASSVLFFQTRSRMTSRDLSPETRTPSLRISCLRSSVSSQTKNGACFFFFYATLHRPLLTSARKKNQKKTLQASACVLDAGRRNQTAPSVRTLSVERHQMWRAAVGRRRGDTRRPVVRCAGPASRPAPVIAIIPMMKLIPPTVYFTSPLAHTLAGVTPPFIWNPQPPLRTRATRPLPL